MMMACAVSDLEADVRGDVERLFRQVAQAAIANVERDYFQVTVRDVSREWQQEVDPHQLR